MSGILDRKRLADAGYAAVGISVGAVIVSLPGILIEPAARIAHSAGWDYELGLFCSGGLASYLSAYSAHILLFLFSVLMLAVTGCCFRRRRIGWEFALSVTLLPLVSLVTSVSGIVSASAENRLYTAPVPAGKQITETYMLRFDEAAAELYHFLPAVTSALLTAVGLILMLRVLRSDFAAETPRLEDDFDESAPDAAPAKEE